MMYKNERTSNNSEKRRLAVAQPELTQITKELTEILDKYKIELKGSEKDLVTDMQRFMSYAVLIVNCLEQRAIVIEHVRDSIDPQVKIILEKLLEFEESRFSMGFLEDRRCFVNLGDTEVRNCVDSEIYTEFSSVEPHYYELVGDAHLNKLRGTSANEWKHPYVGDDTRWSFTSDIVSRYNRATELLNSDTRESRRIKGKKDELSNMEENWLRTLDTKITENRARKEAEYAARVLAVTTAINSAGRLITASLNRQQLNFNYNNLRTKIIDEHPQVCETYLFSYLTRDFHNKPTNILHDAELARNCLLILPVMISGGITKTSQLDRIAQSITILTQVPECFLLPRPGGCLLESVANQLKEKCKNMQEFVESPNELFPSMELPSWSWARFVVISMLHQDVAKKKKARDIAMDRLVDFKKEHPYTSERIAQWCCRIFFEETPSS